MKTWYEKIYGEPAPVKKKTKDQEFAELVEATKSNGHWNKDDAMDYIRSLRKKQKNEKA